MSPSELITRCPTCRVLYRYFSATTSTCRSRLPREVREARLRAAMLPESCESGALRVAVDCSVDNVYRMSDKELRRLSKQLEYMYSMIGRPTFPPAHLILTGLEHGGRVESAFKRHITGYDDYLISKTSQPHSEYFDPRQLLYLNPYSKNVLQEVRNDTVYVLGGVVDLVPRKRLTEDIARRHRLSSARLPVAETMSRCDNVGHLNLPLNSGILLSVYAGSSWSEAFDMYLSKKKGYVLQTNMCSHKQIEHSKELNNNIKELKFNLMTER